MRSGYRRWVLSVVFLLLLVVSLQLLLEQRSRASILKADTCMEEDFRQQALSPALYEEIKVLEKKSACFSDVLTVTMLSGGFFPEKVYTDNKPYLRYKPKEYSLLRSCYESVWADLVYFPIPESEISYENTFGAPRDFGGERTHQGCDLFGKKDEAGYYPILSMTDGVVERIGWLPLGGYRIGIRAPHGGYFYYAHLSEYEKDFKVGETVKAGDILGYMGNTGYGAEGTTGQFPVHLHLGIYIKTPQCEELSVNPYGVLQCFEKKIRKYSY